MTHRDDETVSPTKKTMKSNDDTSRLAEVVRLGSKASRSTIRKALIDDVEGIHSLIDGYAGDGRMLRRSLASLFTELRDYSVVENARGELIGVGAIHILWRDLAELRAIAVSPDHVAEGIGKKLVNHLIEEARGLGIKRVCLLTNQTEFFASSGFEPIERFAVPHKLFAECIHCDKYEECDEEAMIQYLVPASEIEDVPILRKVKAGTALKKETSM